MCYLIEKDEQPKEKIKTDMPYGEGIYFDMPEEEYFNIPYFSRSGAEDILFDEEEYWHKSPMNPDHEPMKATPAMELGTAIHCMLLEPERFAKLYTKKPTLKDFEGKKILKTSEDIKKFLTLVGEKKTGKKEDLIFRAMEYINPEKDIIWDKIINDFNEEIATTGKRILSEENVEILDGIKASLNRKPNMPEILQDIKSEVVIIWKDDATGIMCKCMLDAVRPEAIGEVKSFTVKRRKIPLEKAMTTEIENEQYNHQYYIYKNALSLIINKVNAGKAKVFGEVDQNWLGRFLMNPDKQFFIMFFRTQAPYQCKSFEMEQAVIKNATSNIYYEQAQLMWNTGINKFQRCCEKNGVKRWVDEDDIIALLDEHVPRIMYQNCSI